MILNSLKKSANILQKKSRIFSGPHKSVSNKHKHVLKFGKEPETFVIFEKKLAHRVYRLMHHFHYPKITLLIILIISSYYIFKNPSVDSFIASLNNWSYLGVLIAGMMFALGFTTPFAVGFFIILNPENIFLAALVGSLGALISNLLFLKFIRFSFMDEFDRLEHTKLIKRFINLIENNLGHRISVYLMYIFIGLIIASPLPDEIGVMMLAGIKHINIYVFSIATLILGTIGITLLLLI